MDVERELVRSHRLLLRLYFLWIGISCERSDEGLLWDFYSPDHLHALLALLLLLEEFTLT